MEAHSGRPPSALVADARARASTSGRAASVTSSERAQTTVATSSSAGTSDEHPLEVPERLDEDVLVLRRDDQRRPVRPVGDELGRLASSRARRTRSRRAARTSRWPRGRSGAPRSAARRALRLTLTSKLRMFGRERHAAARPLRRARRACAGASGSLLAPWLGATAGDEAAALPPRVPARAAFISARTVSWTRCGLTSAANTDASSESSFAFEPPSTGAFGAVAIGATPPGSPRARSPTLEPSPGRAGGCAPGRPRARRAPAA